MTHRTLSALGALALAAGAIALPLASAPAAEAHDATATITCEGWTANATAYDQGATGVVIADGVTIHSGTFAGGGSLSGVWPEATATHRLQVTIDSQDGDQYDFAYDETVADCLPPVVVPDPGPQPEPLEASSQSVTEEPWECDATTTWRTTVTSTSSTPYALVNGVWVPDYEATTMASSTVVEERELLPEERTECATPPVIVEPPVQPEPPVTEPTPEAPAPVVDPTPEAVVPVVAPEPTQPAADATGTLPQTGMDPVPLVVLGSVALALMLGGLIAALAGGFSARWKS